MTPSAFVSLAIVASLCSSAQSQVQNWTIWKPSKHSKEMYFFHLSFRELFLSTVQTVSGGEETMEMSRLATAMRYYVQTERKVKISTWLFSSSLLAPVALAPTLTATTATVGTMSTTWYSAAHFLVRKLLHFILLSILFTCKQMKVTHGETVMSLRLTMVRISAVSTVAMLYR